MTILILDLVCTSLGMEISDLDFLIIRFILAGRGRTITKIGGTPYLV